MGVPVFTKLRAGESVPVDQWNAMVDLIQTLQSPQGTEDVQVTPSVMGPSTMDYSPRPIFARVGQQSRDGDFGVSGRQYDLQEINPLANGTQTDQDASNYGVVGTDFNLPSVEISGRYDVPLGAKVRMWPSGFDSFFNFKYDPPAILILGTIDNENGDTLNFTGGNEQKAILVGHAYFNPNDNPDRVFNAVGSINCNAVWGAFPGNQIPPTGTRFNAWLVLIQDCYDADDPTLIQAPNGNARMLWSADNTQGAFYQDGVTPYTVTDSGGDTFTFINAVGTMAGSATVMSIFNSHLVYESATSAAPGVGTWPANKITRVRMYVVVNSEGYTGDLNVYFHSVAWPIANHGNTFTVDGAGWSTEGNVKPQLFVMQTNWVQGNTALPSHYHDAGEAIGVMGLTYTGEV